VKEPAAFERKLAYLAQILFVYNNSSYALS